MTVRGRALPLPRGVRAVVIGVTTLLVWLLPALLAGAAVDQPIAVGEVDRVVAAIARIEAREAGPTDLLVTATLPGSHADWNAERLRDDGLAVARLAALAALLGIAGFLYVSVAFARGRGVAFLSCIAFAALPPVWSEGAILRPEAAAALFGGLALVLLVGFPIGLAHQRPRSLVSRVLFVVAVATCTATATGLAVASTTVYGVYLLPAAGCMLLVVVLQVVRFVRAIRRFPHALPLRAWSAGAAPWVVLAFLSMVMTNLVVRLVPDDPVAPTAVATVASVGLLPASWWLAAPLVALAALGGTFAVVRTGLAIGRRRRLDADAILLIWCAVLLLQRLKLPPTADALPAAPALALLVGDGLRTALVVVVGRLGPGRTPPVAGATAA